MVEITAKTNNHIEAIQMRIMVNHGLGNYFMLEKKKNIGSDGHQNRLLYSPKVDSLSLCGSRTAVTNIKWRKS